MAIFFVGWELWEDLTFILGCCIVLVVCVGSIKLWWTNRAIRKLEVLNEERSARVREMQHCGINSGAVNDVPFGIRAIQSGIEVDGIWISRHKTPDTSQIASSTTLVGDQAESARSKGKRMDSGSDHQRRSSRWKAGSCSDDQTWNGDVPLPPGSLRMTTYAANDAITVEHQMAGLPIECYVSTGAENERNDENADAKSSHIDMPPRRLRHPQAHLPSTEANQGAAARRPTGEQSQYGSAEVFANRDTRRANKDFEVLPAGALGPRNELQDRHIGDTRPQNGTEVKQSPGKLRKKRPLGTESDTS